MYVVLFHRFDRLGCNLINYIAQIIYAHHHGYCIKIMDHKENYPKYPNSKYYIVLLNYITNVLNVKNKQTDEILYNCKYWNRRLPCIFSVHKAGYTRKFERSRNNK